MGGSCRRGSPLVLIGVWLKQLAKLRAERSIENCAAGYTSGEMIGQHFWRFFTREDQQRNLPAQILEVATAHGRHETEGWRVRKDGTKFWVVSRGVV